MSDSAPRYHPLRVQAVVEETHDARSLVFEVPPELAPSFAYRPGQFVTLRLPVAGRQVPRCYSMSSAPGLDTAPRITVKRVAGGRGSNWVCDQVHVGDVLQVMPPSGQFTPRRWDGDFLLLAGGSGITPVFSILRTVLQQGTGRVLLLYANRDERSVIFRQALNALAAAHPERLQVIHWLDSVQGVPTQAQLQALARGWSQAQAYICGPGPFMDAGVAALLQAGLADEQVHVERFSSLPDEAPDAVTDAAPDATPDAAPAQGMPLQAAPDSPVDAPTAIDEAQVLMHLDGQDHRFSCNGQESLLEAALRHKINAPYSCQAGMCSSCMCQLVQGRVHLRANDALDARDLARGWILACQAVPLTEAIEVRYRE